MNHNGNASDELNPLSNIPADLSLTPSPHQKVALPIERTPSTIPRADLDPNEDCYTHHPNAYSSPSEERGMRVRTWDYPSPQQFYNALVRKGWETPEEHVQTMVDIHNWLNEQAWGEVLKWERESYDKDDVQLARFKGRPGEMSPKARIWLFAGWLFPSVFNTEPPFDRHDWIVRRPQTGEEVRYVIDYYSAPPESDGSPSVSLDVRPALDNIGSIKARIAVATRDAWESLKSSGKATSS